MNKLLQHITGPFLPRGIAMPFLFLAVATAARAQAPPNVHQNGDFHAGDRVIVLVRGEPTLSDTLTLGNELSLKLRGIPDISLAGVRRSDIHERVTSAIAKYVRAPDVQVTTFLRIGLLGQVTRPGYYQVPVDVPMSDALMAAGGPTSSASPDRTIVRRGSRELLDERSTRDDMVSGATLGQLDIRSGDEIVVAERSQRSWATAAQILGAVSGLVVSIVYISKR